MIAAPRAPTKKKNYTTLAPAPSIPSLGGRFVTVVTVVSANLLLSIWMKLTYPPIAPLLTSLGEGSQPAGFGGPQGFWSRGHISETVDPDSNSSAAGLWTYTPLVNIIAACPPPWSPVSATNSPIAGHSQWVTPPTDTTTHAAVGQTGYHVRRARKLFYGSWEKITLVCVMRSKHHFSFFRTPHIHMMHKTSLLGRLCLQVRILQSDLSVYCDILFV